MGEWLNTAAPERAQASSSTERATRQFAFASFLGRPKLAYVLAGLAMLLAAPSLFIGFHLDDFVGRYIYSDLDGASDLYRVYTGGYGIANGNPADAHWQIEQGYAPWWIYPKLLVAMWRPLGLVTHFYEFRWWPNTPWPMHLHNLLWLGLGVVCATRLYRGLMGPVVGGLAALLYAVDHTHAFAAGFICNRYILISAAFGLLALDNYCRSRSASARLTHALLGPLFYAASLLAGEAGISIFIYVFAFAAFAERGSLKRRATGALPYFLITVLWRAVYNGLHRGGRFSGLYIDPGREPLHFLTALLHRGPVLLLGELFVPPAEVYMFVGEAGKRVHLALAYLFLLALGVALFTLLRNSRVARFWTAGMVLSVFPASATHPNNRLLFFCSIGAMGLVAELWNLFANELKGVVLSLREKLSGAFAASILFMHLVVSPFLVPFVACSLLLTTPIKRAFADVGPDAVGKDAVFVTSPDHYSVKLMPLQRRVDGEPLPRRWRVLSIGAQSVRVTRTTDKTLEVLYDGGLLRDPSLELYRDRRLAFAVGDTVVLKGLVIRVLETLPDGRAERVAFQFDTSLDAKSFRFYYWAHNHFETFHVPAVGATTVLPPAQLELGL